jgi:hypothetical protein
MWRMPKASVGTPESQSTESICRHSLQLIYDGVALEGKAWRTCLKSCLA